MCILHTVPFAFPKVLTRRICFTIKSVCSHGNHFLHPRDLDILFRSKNILRSQSARRLIQKRSINRFLILDSLTLPSFFSILFMVISCLYTLSLSFPFAVRSFSISFLCSLILFIKFVTLDWSPAPLLLRLEISHFSSASFLFQGGNQRKKQVKFFRLNVPWYSAYAKTKGYSVIFTSAMIGIS